MPPVAKMTLGSKEGVGVGPAVEGFDGTESGDVTEVWGVSEGEEE